MAKLPSLIVTSTLLASPAHAEEIIVAPGVHFIVSFGDDLRVGLGADLRVTEASVDEGGVHSGYGAFGQATWIITDGIRVAAGLHAGVVDYDLRLDVELGWAFRWLDGAGAHGLQLGFTYPGRPLEVMARGTVAFADEGPIFEGHLGVGLRLNGMFGEETLRNIKGRPLRVDGEQRLGPVAFGARSRPATPLGRAWLDAARAEAASVPAFMTLARDLDHLGARHLARRARRAAREEVHHTQLCNALASRHLGREVRAFAPPLPTAHVSDLARLAIESWTDGCLGEGIAAEQARVAHAEARDPEACHALAVIARDEAAHAELAWSVIEHALALGGRRVRETLAASIATSCSTPSRTLADVPEASTTHGLLDALRLAETTHTVRTRSLHRARSLKLY